MKQLTENQLYVIQTLEDRGAWITAQSAKRAWENGKSAHIDDRNAAGRGLIRKFKQANKEATGA